MGQAAGPQGAGSAVASHRSGAARLPAKSRNGRRFADAVYQLSTAESGLLRYADDPGHQADDSVTLKEACRASDMGRPPQRIGPRLQPVARMSAATCGNNPGVVPD